MPRVWGEKLKLFTPTQAAIRVQLQEKFRRLLRCREWREQWDIVPAKFSPKKEPLFDEPTVCRAAYIYRTHCSRQATAAANGDAAATTPRVSPGFWCRDCGSRWAMPWCPRCRRFDVVAELRSPVEQRVVLDINVRDTLFHDWLEQVSHWPFERQSAWMLDLILADAQHRDNASRWQELVQRPCPMCRTSPIGLESILREDGSAYRSPELALQWLSRLRLCRMRCGEFAEMADGWEDRLAEVRAKRQAAGDLAVCPDPGDDE